MRHIHLLLGTAILLGAPAIVAAPVVTGSYGIEVYASGIGAATGLQIAPDGTLYATDYAGGRVLTVGPGGAVTVLASGIPYPTDVALTDAGRVFVSSGGGQAVYEIVNGVAQVFVGSGLSYPTSIEADGNSLLVANSGNGTIARVGLDGSVSVILTGLSSPNAPYGLSFNRSSKKLHFIDHATGGIYEWDFRRDPSLLASVTTLGGTFTEIGFKNRLFFTDVNLGYLLWQEPNGSVTVFASGFSGKGSPPFIGPNGIAFDGPDRLYVGDADDIYLITPMK